MGDRNREKSNQPDGDRTHPGDADRLPGGNAIEQLMANPATRLLMQRLLRARQQGGPAEKETDSKADEAAEKTADAQIEAGEKKSEAEEKEKGRAAARKLLGGHDEIASAGSHSHEEGDGYVKKSTSTVGASIDGRDAGVHFGREAGTEKESDGDEGETDYKQATGISGGIGMKDGQLAVDAKTSQVTEDEKGAHETSQSVGFDHGKLKLGAESKREQKRKVTEVGADGKKKEVTKTSSKSVEGGIEIGKDSVGADVSFGKQKESGASSSTKVGAEVGKEGASGSVAQTWTSKSGKSATVSVHAGVEVHTSDVVQIDEHHFLVSYKRVVSGGAGAGGGAHGASVSAGASHESFQTGSRVFENKDDALEFKEHAATLLGTAVDPGSVDGALSLQVGESRGRGSGSGISGGATGAMDGASVGVSGHKSSSGEISVQRKSKTEFWVTYTASGEEGGALTESGLGVGLSKTTESGHAKSATVRFDLGSAEGKRAFEQFCEHPKLLKKGEAVAGGEVIADETDLSHATGDGVSLAGANDTITHRTSESTRTDEEGKHEEYDGEDAHDHDPGWIAKHVFGDDQLHSSVQIASRQENDKDAGYTVVGKISGESGKYNRGKMQHLYGHDENWDESKVKPSGEWTMTTDIDKRTVNAMERKLNRFQGKNADDRMRALGQWIADDGAKAINQIDQDWGNQQLNWDIELKGDPNFPGRAGREAIEAQTRKLGEALATAADSAAVGAEIQGEVQRLEARRAAVADTSRYTDLPNGLRQQQLQMIDREIAGYESLRHRAYIQAMKRAPGETGLQVATRANSPKAYAAESPEQKPIAELRDKIALQDFAIADYQKECARADQAMRAGSQHVKKRSGPTSLFARSEKAHAEAQALYERMHAGYNGLDGVRMLFLSEPPEAARWIGQKLLSQIEEYVTMAASAQEKYYESARAMLPLLDQDKLVEHADFWADVRETMGPEDEAAAEEASANSDSAGGDDDSKDDHSPPPPPTSMKL